MPAEMTPDGLRTVLADLQLTQGAGAELVGVDTRTMRKWLAGDARIPMAVAIIFRLIKRKRITKTAVEKCHA